MGINLFGDTGSHHSSIADIGEMFDPTSWFAPKAINPHTYAKPIASFTNEVLSPIVKPLNRFGTMITPGKAWIDDQIPLAKKWNDVVENRPLDAAAIAAATYFTGGALAGAGGAGAGVAGHSIWPAHCTARAQRRGQVQPAAPDGRSLAA